MNNVSQLQTAKGLAEIKDNDRILIHEHIFNKYPYRLQGKMEDYVINELKKAFDQGVSIICDLTAYTKPYNYYRIINESPVKIVTCLGFYTPRYVPAQLKNKDANGLIRAYSKIIEKGLGTQNIKPGILKVAAQSYELSLLEQKFFHVVGQLSRVYDIPIAVHAPKGTYNHICTLISEGAKPEKIFAAHIETSITKEEEYAKRLQDAISILKLGSYIQIADFGNVFSSKKCIKGLEFVKEIIDKGFLKQLLLSADSYWRWKNSDFVVKEYNYGKGKHYTYTKDFALPMIQGAYPHIDLDQTILCDNPRNLFR